MGKLAKCQPSAPVGWHSTEELPVRPLPRVARKRNVRPSKVWLTLVVLSAHGSANS